MHAKTILVSCGPVITLERASALFAAMDADVRALKTPLDQAVDSGRDFEEDLLVVDNAEGRCNIAALEDAVLKGGRASVFVLAPQPQDEGSAEPQLPTRVIADFAFPYVTDAEIKLRCRRLLWPGEVTSDADFVHAGPLTINLATYQVKVNGDPVDLTFMEYSLLSFLVTHPGRIYSREALLSQVWGFDYYGGSRTVDVHIRRLRAKLGAEVAQHIETVRGAGYLWEN